MSTTKKSLSIFWRENWRHPRLFAAILITWPIGIFLQVLALPLIAAQAINKLVEVAGQGTIDYWPIFIPYFVSFLMVGAIGQACAFFGLVLLSKLETVGRNNIQNRVFETLQNQSMHFHANSFSGALVNQANRFASAYVGLTDILTLTLLDMAVKSVVAIVIIAIFSPIIAIAMFMWTVLFMTINYRQTKKRIALSRQAAAADTVITAHLADSMGNIGVIKAFAREEDEATLHNQKVTDRGFKKYAAWIKATKNGSVAASLMIMLQLIVLVLSVYSVMNGLIELGTLLLIQVYLSQLMNVLWNFSGVTRHLEQNLSDAEEMTKILDQPIELQDVKNPQPSRIKHGAIEFSNMEFTHADNSANDKLFTNFNLTIKSGEKIGLVGHSGSGKTTLTKLLLRFVDVDGGTITIDGQDIRTISQADLRRSVAYVPQEPLLFHRSLHDNIAYGNPNATEAEVIHAAKQAYAHEFIDKLPNGYNTEVGERGVKLSGGQRQRIAIARAILKNAPILVLDEATSALDSESERLIQQALKGLMKGRTAIIIAHRLSTVQKMDRIVVLADGKIVEQGSHKQLLATNGAYAKLWAHQSGGFLED